MDRYELGRQDRGRLAEVLASGLHKHPLEPLETLVEGHTREYYRSLIRTRIKISIAESRGIAGRTRSRSPFLMTSAGGRTSFSNRSGASNTVETG